MRNRFAACPINAFLAILFATGVSGCANDAGTPTMQLGPAAAPRMAKAASGPVVTAANPAAAKRDTTLDVQVIGSGFSAGSRVDFLLAGSVDPRIHTNSTRFVSSTELVANITIDATAAVDYRDVAVTTATGKKGIGTEAFVVLNGGTITVSGLTQVSVWDVNSSGVAVGYGSISDNGCISRAFAWSQSSGAVLLPLPSGYCGSNASRISEGGKILGAVRISRAAWEAARWTPTDNGSWSVEVIGRPATSTTWLTTHGINDVGSIASSWKNSDGSLDSWYWNATSGWRKLARPAGTNFCELENMNDSDEMVGYCHAPGGSGVYWSGPDAAAVQLPSPSGGLAGNAYTITAAGVIRGASTIGGIGHTVLWIPNGSGWTIQDLGTLSMADLNEQGSYLVTSTARAEYTPAGGVTENLGVHLTGGVISNESVTSVTWIVGYDDGAHPAQKQAFWFKR